MIGDRLDTDLWGAKQLGIGTIWYNPLQKKLAGDFAPDFEITDFRDIVAGSGEW
jgi:FMN phosphatase YigB (HAD superfamily)